MIQSCAPALVARMVLGARGCRRGLARRGRWSLPPSRSTPATPTSRRTPSRSRSRRSTKSGEQWTLYFLAFLKKAAGSKEVQLVFYDDRRQGARADERLPHRDAAERQDPRVVGELRRRPGLQGRPHVQRDGHAARRWRTKTSTRKTTSHPEVIALVVVLLADAAAARWCKLPAPADLVAAVRGGDDVEIERVAARLGAVRLEAWAEHGKPRRAAGGAARAAARRRRVVGAARAGAPRRRRRRRGRRARGASARGSIAEGITPEQRERDEMPSDVPARAARELAGAWRRRSRSSRPCASTAIEALATLRAVTRVDDKALAALLGDGDATVRRAAAEALAGAAGGRQAARGGAGQGRGARGGGGGRRVALPRRGARGAVEAGRRPSCARASWRRRRASGCARWRVDEKVPLADRLDLVACLRVGKKDPDQKVLDELARKPPESLRRRARALGGR